MSTWQALFDATRSAFAQQRNLEWACSLGLSAWLVSNVAPSPVCSAPAAHSSTIGPLLTASSGQSLNLKVLVVLPALGVFGLPFQQDVDCGYFLSYSSARI
jgi:hypothetical protein